MDIKEREFFMQKERQPGESTERQRLEDQWKW